MDVKSIIEYLHNSLKSNENSEENEKLKLFRKLSENAEDLIKIDSFFELPLDIIFSVVSLINFSLFETDILELIEQIIKKTIKFHKKEKETLLLIENMQIQYITFSLEDYFNILGCFSNCSFLVNFCKLNKEENFLPNPDYEYDLMQKDKEIEDLKSKIETNSSLSNEFDEKMLMKGEKRDVQFIVPKPWFYEPNIFKAVAKGKVSSVEYSIQNGLIDKNIRNKEGEALIHIATKYGQLNIIQYLIEKQNVNSSLSEKYGWTPLHIAAWKGYLPIVKYLIEKGHADINAKKGDGFTPLHVASIFGQLEIVHYLTSKGADKNEKDNNGQRPYDVAKTDEIKNILK